MVGIVGAMVADAQFFYSLMKMRDFDGSSLFTHFIHTKQYIVLETRSIQ